MSDATSAENVSIESTSASITPKSKHPAHSQPTQDRPLPPGWTKNYSKSKQQHYYFHGETGKSQWHFPSPRNHPPKRKHSSEHEKPEQQQSAPKHARHEAVVHHQSGAHVSTTPTGKPQTQPFVEPKVAIIVPFQDLHPEQHRSQHLKSFAPYMEEFLKKQGLKKYHIYIIEQTDDGKKFNRGKLLNAGFDLAKHDYNTFIFHDVDLLPGDDLGMYYARVPSSPLHIARVWDRYSNNSKYIGGIVSFNLKDFEHVNGFPNNFWGWGGEDDELYKRIKAIGLRIVSPPAGTITDLEQMDLKQKLSVLKKTNWKCMVKWELLDEHDKTWKENGLNGLNYKIDKNTAISEHCTKVTVSLGTNNHWSDSKTTWN